MLRRIHSLAVNPAALSSYVPLFGEVLQELCDIPFAATTAGEGASPSGNGIHIKTLLEQFFDIVPLGAAAMAHDLICRAGILRIH